MASGTANAMIDLRTLLIAAVSSEGNVGNNVFMHGGTGDDPTFPYIVIQDEGGDGSGIDTHDGAISAERFEFSVHIHTRWPDQGKTLHDLVVDGLHGVSGTQGSTNFGHILREGGTQRYLEKTKTNEQIIDFTALLTNS